MKDIDNALAYIPKYFKVITKADKGGLTDLVPMRLWPSQAYYIENRTNRDIILKSRQTGMSTGVMADDAHAFFTQPYQRESLITHDQETSVFLFHTFQRFYNNLPKDRKPESDWKSGTRMRFPKLDSYIYIDSAKSDSLGIGHTLNRAHLSEVARYPARKAEGLFADISQTVPEGGHIVLESTPRGRGGLFYRLYNAAKKKEINYKPFFFPWWWDITCVRDSIGILKYSKEESQLISNYNLSPQQIAFRREKIAELGDLFYQEYCENDIDCWLTSDVSVFDGVAIRRYLQQIQKPLIVEGDLNIWKDVIGGEKYLIGVDPAGGLEKGDYSVASVLRAKNNEYVARLRGKIPPDMFAQQVLRLGHRYNMATLGVERMMHGHTILRILMENNYPEIYHHTDYDSLLGMATTKPGWITSGKTKPIMIDAMGAAIRAGDIIIYSENFLLEASGYIWDGNKADHPPGGYDDELDALMIALQLRETAPITDSGRFKVSSYASA